MEADSRKLKRYTAALSDSIADGSDVWVVDSDEGSFCEMTTPFPIARDAAHLTADALNAYSPERSAAVEELLTEAVEFRHSQNVEAVAHTGYVTTCRHPACAAFRQAQERGQ